MCWNEDISINTFLFACLVLIFIFLTNTYSKYKLRAFDNPLVYLFILEVALMQLIEYFLWKNLKNKSMNKFLSKIAYGIVVIQIPTIMLMIQNIQIKYILLASYAIYIMIYLAHKQMYSPLNFHTSISKTGHLYWEWSNYNGYENKILLFMYLFLYIVSVLLINNIEITLIVLLSLFVSVLFYFKDNTFSSMWCWLTNLSLLYFIANILIIQPFYEYNKLC
jgi:hypothetical protein